MRQNKIFSKKNIIMLLLIILLGAFLRFNNFKDNFFFGHDQGRDIYEVFNMVKNHKLKIVGPGTDIPGLFCGPLYYYLTLPFYLLSGFNPNAVAAFFIILNLLGVILLFYFGAILVNPNFGLIAGFLWAVSFEQANFARFISNPSFISIFTIIFFLGNYLFFVKKKKTGLTISIIGYGLSTQLDFYLVYLAIFYPLYYLIYRPKLNLKNLILNGLLLVALLSTFIIAEIRFKFIGTQSFLKYLGHHESYPNNIFDNFKLFFLSLSKSLYYSFLAIDKTIVLIIFFGLAAFYLFKEKIKEKKIFLLIWLFSTLPLFIFRTNVVGGNFIHSSIQAATTFIFAYIIYFFFSAKKTWLGIIFLVIIFVFNLNLFTKDRFVLSFILGHQPMVYKDEKALIDYTYFSAKGKHFSICTLSNPLFVNVLWSTAYKIYGEKKYGYLPFWAGPKQETNMNFLEYDRNHVGERFIILEPSDQLSEFAKKTTVYLEDRVSIITEAKKFGEIVIQKRKLTKDKNQLIDSQKLLKKDLEIIKSITDKDYRYSCFLSY